MNRQEWPAFELAHQVVADTQMDGVNANLLVFGNATYVRLLARGGGMIGSYAGTTDAAFIGIHVLQAG